MRILTPFLSSRNISSDLFKDMDQMFDGFLSAPLYDDRDFMPAMDIIEENNHYLLTLDVPGIRKEDLKIEITDNMLTISGERKREDKTESQRLRKLERTYGSFKRSFSLPNSINTEKIEAHYENGVLELSLPKSTKAAPKHIEIQSGKNGFFDKLIEKSNPKKDIEINNK